MALITDPLTELVRRLIKLADRRTP